MQSSTTPLYLAEGEIVTAIDSKARRIADYMPVTVTTPERSLILGGPDDEPDVPTYPMTCPWLTEAAFDKSFDVNAMDPDFKWPQSWTTDLAVDQQRPGAA